MSNDPKSRVSDGCPEEIEKNLVELVSEITDNVLTNYTCTALSPI